MLHLLTTAEGAWMPETALVEDFPVLLRLNKEWFDFSQARPKGEDLRITSEGGLVLAHQVEYWDASKGEAAVWVRIPSIRGDAKQAIHLRWGHPSVEDGSSGSAVFNGDNGYLSVWHMGEEVRDEVGTVETKDEGTSATRGLIGMARRFTGNEGISGGERIDAYPTGEQPHTSEIWFRAERPNSRLIGWGNEKAQGKVVVEFRSPPRIQVDCYFSDGNVQSISGLPMGEWIHVAHTYQRGEARVYVNGVLSGISQSKASPLAIQSPARLWIGGWHGYYDFVGEIDETRVSKGVRSADWLRLQHENQKPLQTLVGHLVRSGSEFSASHASMEIEEGGTGLISAKAGGAQKVYWILVNGEAERIVGVDQFQHAFAAGRVNGDQRMSIRFKAVYPDGVKTLEIPITVREAIPEPQFTLEGPAHWDGRSPLELTPRIDNMETMRRSGAAELNSRWEASGLAVVKEEGKAKLTLLRAMNSGLLTVALTLDNGGAPSTRTITIQVREPERDPWVRRESGPEEMPVDNQFIAREEEMEGTLRARGALEERAESVFLKLYAGDKLIRTEAQGVVGTGRYDLSTRLRAGLVKYRVEFGVVRGGKALVLRTATNLVCGDVFIIQGQSNALATDTGETAPNDPSTWIRTFGSTSRDPRFARTARWGEAVWKEREGDMLQVGYWGMELARRLVESQRLPICVINGAVGGSRIDQHQRNSSHPEDVASIYGRLLWRVRQAGLSHGVRAILWHQGENDQGADGPSGGFGWETYQRHFTELAAAWKQDFPNVRHHYVFQIWPKACAMGFQGSDNKLREVQRGLPKLFSNMGIMSTLGIKPPGGCHYPLEGWAEFARLIQPLMERDLYGLRPSKSITPPNLIQARRSPEGNSDVVLVFDQPVVWSESLKSQFHFDGKADRVLGALAEGNSLILKVADGAPPQAVTYLDSRNWNPNNLLLGANGIAALTFCDVPIVAP